MLLIHKKNQQLSTEILKTFTHIFNHEFGLYVVKICCIYALGPTMVIIQ